MKEPELVKRTDYLIGLGNKCLGNAQRNPSGNEQIPKPDYLEFRTSVLSFIEKLYGKDTTYFNTFHHNVHDVSPLSIQNGLGILQAIKNEIDSGWLKSIRELVSAEVFTDFLEMSEHLLSEGYKDPAAVMIGSVLEEHLRQLCTNHGIDPHILKGTDSVPKKASLLNDELKKATIYSPVDHKQVTTWLGIRNSAAHGKYGDYIVDQVRHMHQGVENFITRVS